MCTLVRPIRENKFRICFPILILNGHCVVILFIIQTSIRFRGGVTDMPSAKNKTWPMIGFIPSRTTKKSASVICQPLFAAELAAYQLQELAHWQRF